MTNINLLPEDLVVSKSQTRLVGLLKKTIISVFGVFLILIILFSAIFIKLNFDLKNSQARQENLKVSIKSLEQTEQSLFLLRERLAKIKSIQSFPSAPTDLVRELELLFQKNPGANLSEVKVSSDKVSFLARATSNDQVGNLLANLLTDINLKKIELNSFSFSPDSGYLLDLEISR